MAERQSMIHVRNGFSEARGMGSCNTQMQYDDLDDGTRNILFNYIAESLKSQYGQKWSDNYKSKEVDLLCRLVMTHVLQARFDINKLYDLDYLIPVSEKIITQAPYNEVFDFIEALCRFRYSKYDESKLKRFCELLNSLLESEYVGYRIIDGHFAPITDENEIAAIEEACDNTYQGPRTHISKAVVLISDREHKDYKNCIKESISAVESICSIIVDNENATLGSAIKQLKDKGLKIHSALEGALSRLYGYTSDEGGIRHAEGMFETEVTFEEAKFMLVSCSAFVNYLTANYGRVGGNHA